MSSSSLLYSLLLVATTVISSCFTSYIAPPETMEYTPYAGEPPLPIPYLDPLCKGVAHEKILLPWDCSGYVKCLDSYAYWTRCPFDPRSVGIMDDPICIPNPDKCKARVQGRWQEFCRKRGRAPYPSSDCTSYHDCSIGFEGIKRDCPNELFYNVDMNMCVEFSFADCGNRRNPLMV